MGERVDVGLEGGKMECGVGRGEDGLNRLNGMVKEVVMGWW